MHYKLVFISNITIEPYWKMYHNDSQFLKKADLIFLSYNEYRSAIRNYMDADIIAICLSFDELYPNIWNNAIIDKNFIYEFIQKDCIYKCKEIYTYVKTHSDACVIWFGFEDYYCFRIRNYGTLLFFEGVVDQLNLALNNMLKEDTFIDFKRLIATVGIKNAYDTKGKYRWNSPYTKELIYLMADEVYKQHLITTGNTKKCLVLDCDNVLWGGILSEDGIEGIQIGNSGLGRPFQDFQRYLLDLYYHGVILAVCSKNDETDVLRVFKEHTGMLLKEEHIACGMCNWNNKPDNIKSIAQSLNIGLDSIVFVDDSIFEIEYVKMMLPEVTTVLYQKDSVYNGLSCFNLKPHTDIQTVVERTKTYKTNRLRAELQKNALSYEDYITSLELIVDIHKTTDCELVRLSELTQRTNKCTNGGRYTVQELKELIASDFRLFSVCVSDKFSNLGLVGAIGICKENLKLFSLSCRALGRNVEKEMCLYARKNGAMTYTFKSTGKNDGIKKMFEQNIRGD